MAAGRFDDLISLCTYQVGDEGNHGTGFAVSSTLLVTCRHVVEGVPAGGSVPLVRAADRLALSAKVLSMAPAGQLGLMAEPTAGERWPDFALLELIGGAFPTAVVLDATQPEEGATVRVGGFASWLGYDTQAYDVGSDVNLDEEGHRYTRIKQDIVDEGVSGSAVVTPAGFVCGFVNASRMKGGPNGGYFVPLSDVLDAAPELRQLHELPDAAAVEWLKRIGDHELQAVGRDRKSGAREGTYLSPAIINLLFHETTVVTDPPSPRQWTIEVEGNPAAMAPWQLGSLGDGLFDALDNWARRHELRTKDQVEILSHVLGRAVLPDPITTALGAVDQLKPPIVRLRTAAEDPLAGIPWEYVMELSTPETCSFSRYIPTPSKGELDLAGKQSIRVLVVVNQVGKVSSKSTAEALRSGFASLNGEFATTDGQRVDATVLAQPDWNTFSATVRPGRDADDPKWDVVHIVTTAAPGGALIMPSNTRSTGPVVWNTISNMLVASGAKVVVLQLGSQPAALPPPMSVYYDVLTAKSTINAQFGESKTVSETRALVLCQHITNADDVTGFSDSFYRQLAHGQSVEAAVQKARRTMSEVASEEDYAAFGAVSVVTTMQGDIRLIEEERAPSFGPEPGTDPAGGRQSANPPPDQQKKQSTRTVGRL